MTGFIACVFLYPSRVPLNGAFEVLEPDDGKLSRPVLRGPNPGNGVRLLGYVAARVCGSRGQLWEFNCGKERCEGVPMLCRERYG
jgi:hypothetical protein